MSLVRKNICGFKTEWRLEKDGSGYVEVFLPSDGALPTVRVQRRTYVDLIDRPLVAEINCCATGGQSPVYMRTLSKALIVAAEIAEGFDRTEHRKGRRS